MPLSHFIMVSLQSHYFGETNRLNEATVRNILNSVAVEYRQFDRGPTQDIYGSDTFNQTVTAYLGISHVTGEIPDIGEMFYPASAVIFADPGKND
jgi:hypothetical protein